MKFEYNLTLAQAQEGDAVNKDHRPPAYWPSSTGGIVVEDLTIQYAPTLPAALRNLSFTIKPSEKIGVVSMHRILRDGMVTNGLPCS